MRFIVLCCLHDDVLGNCMGEKGGTKRREREEGRGKC